MKLFNNISVILFFLGGGGYFKHVGMIKCFIYWLETEKGSCHKTQQRNSFTVKLPVYMAMSRGLRMESAHQEQL